MVTKKEKSREERKEKKENGRTLLKRNGICHVEHLLYYYVVVKYVRKTLAMNTWLPAE